MESSEKDLGRLLTVHGIAPAYLQRAVFIVILSFLFFLAMMFAFYIRQSLVVFLLASAFLVLYLITLISWVMLRRNVVHVYERGLMIRHRSVMWDEIASINDSGLITVNDGKPVTLPATLSERERLVDLISSKTSRPTAGV